MQCPHCRTHVVLKELPHPSWWANYRVCPGCAGLFTPDPDTKIRQGCGIALALVSLLFTLFLYYESNDWLAPAVASYVALGALIYHGNKKMYLVPYRKAPAGKTGGGES